MQIEHLLRGAGFDVVLAADAETGMEAFAAAEFQLVLTDLTLPGKSGFDLCREVKSDPRQRHVPVVVLTGSGDAEDVLRGLQAGADGYLSKDRPPGEIAAGVREILQRGERSTPPDERWPIRVAFLDHQFEVRAGREQLLDVLLSAFEDLDRLNKRYLDEIHRRRQAEQALAQSAAELQRSNRDLEDFAHIVSHDLQAPLRSVISFCTLLQRRYEGQLGSDADEFIGFAIGGAQRMQTLIRDLLAFSRVGTSGNEFVTTDCQAVCNEVLANLKAEIDDSGAVVTCDALPTLQADRTQLAQLFQNLIGNAIKFRGEQRPRIHVAVRPENGQWRFSVRDNGIGIDAKYAERIFQAFRRLHAHEDYPGTGMGLAICRRIVERHGGRLEVTSTPGEGSEFWFTLPASASRAQA
jgi:signal transduction histidine kinase